MYARKIDALDAINHYPTINRFRNVIQRVDGSDIAESYSHDIDYFDFERNILSKHYTLDERKHNIFTCICISILYVYVYVYLYLSIHTHTHIPRYAQYMFYAPRSHHIIHHIIHDT